VSFVVHDFSAPTSNRSTPSPPRLYGFRFWARNLGSGTNVGRVRLTGEGKDMVPERPPFSGHVVSGNEINSGRAEEVTVIER
jgi:hypothetical protein